MGYSAVTSDLCQDSSGTENEDFYSSWSYFRRGSNSAYDGINIRFRLQEWGYVGFPPFGYYNHERTITLISWNWYDHNADFTDDTGWIESNSVWIQYKIDILLT